MAYWTKCHDGTVMSVKKSSELRATTIRLVHVAESLYVEKIRMQVEREIIERWLEDKLGGSRRRLRAPGAAEFTYQGPQWGHPSNFAAVKMRCEPSDALTFRSVAVAPPAISEAYFEKILAAIRGGILDAILATDHPALGMSVTLTEIGWDDGMSSEVAFARARSRSRGQADCRGGVGFHPEAGVSDERALRCIRQSGPFRTIQSLAGPATIRPAGHTVSGRLGSNWT